MLSVLIIVKDRADHLRQVLKGLEMSELQPSEVVVVHMNEDPITLDTRLNLVSFRFTSSTSLPLAEARNAAAAHASYETMIFLDVDCIPAPTTLGALVDALDHNQLVMAQPLYLPHSLDADKPLSSCDLRAQAVPSAARANVRVGPSTNYALFWTLAFGITKDSFKTIGGFDETYKGYGGEDTDFAFRARKHKLALYYSNAEVYHQHHPSYDPPLNHLEDIIANSQRFYDRWGEWPMLGWLKAFERLGYITLHEHEITLESLPSEDEINACLKQ